MKRIGIDVGGTNTDAVLLHDKRVVAAAKQATTADVTAGIRKVLTRLLEGNPEAAAGVSTVIIGSTHFLNAVVERRRLTRVAAMRICTPTSTAVAPLCDWPRDLRDIVDGGSYLVPGGHEVEGRESGPFEDAKVREVALRIADSGVGAVAISSTFSPLRPEHERRAEAIIREACPDIHVTRSSDLGRLGLLERENAAILNGALSALAQTTCSAFRAAIGESGLDAALFLTQNDGTVIPAEVALQFPIFSIASGPTNSMRGAAFLSGLQNATVVDVGGTTTDVGVLANGFPREANRAVFVGGVRTLFRMPDICSVGLGGGTVVDLEHRRLGPESVGYGLPAEARVFGGNTLTATDCAVALGWMELGDRARVTDISSADLEWFRDESRRIIESVIDRMKSRAGDVPLIAVGGGAPLIPDSLAGVSDIITVEHHDVANAVGAAIAQISGEVDRIFSDVGRNEAIDRATRSAFERAVKNGADPGSLVVVDVEEMPLTYIAGNNRRVRVRVAGNMQ